MCKVELENSPKSIEMRGVCLDFQNLVQYQDSLDPEWYGFRSGPTRWELHVMVSIWNVSVLYASGGSLIQANTNYKIYHGRAREVKNEMTTLMWYICMFPREEKHGAESSRVVILRSVVKLHF